MASKSDIEWTDASWTPIRARNLKTGKIGWHCEHATTGCEFCYSEGFNLRLGTGLPFKPGHRADIELFLDDEMLTAPLRWKKPRKIFVCSMTDLFADFVKDEWIDKMFAVMALCPQHTFQVLTKRAERMRDYCGEVMADQTLGLNRFGIVALATGLHGPAGSLPSWPLPNVWLGVSCERQQEADERIPLLLQTPAAIRFISAEPLLGPIDLSPKADASYQRLSEWYGPNGFDPSGSQPRRERMSGFFPKLDWVIVGGESGHNARPMHPQWGRDIRDQCAAAGVSFFFKQWGEFADLTCVEDRHRAASTEDHIFTAAGKTLGAGYRSGRECNGMVEENWREKGGAWMGRVGKKAAGRLLDGREWNEFPQVRA